MITPIKDRVMVKQLGEKISTESIIIPERFDNKPSKLARVEAVGEEVKEVKAGDRILMLTANWEGTRFTHEDEEYVMLRESEILAVL